MPDVLSITAPIFIVMFCGYAAVKGRLVAAEAVPELGRIVLYFTLPALVFGNLARMQLDEVINPDFLTVYALGSLVTLLLAMLFFYRVRKADAVESSVKAMGTAVSNSVFVGYPVLLQVFGETATPAFMMAVMVENILILPLALMTMEYARSRQDSRRTGNVLTPVLIRLTRNPVLLAIAAGLLASALAIPIPKAIETSLDILAKASAAMALLVIGGSLVGNRIRGDLTDIGLVMAGKLILHPLVIALGVWLLPAFDPTLALAAILVAAMPMMSVYPILGSNYGYRQICASILVVTTVSSFLTLTVALYLLT